MFTSNNYYSLEISVFVHMNIRTYADGCNFTNACDNGLQISSETEGFSKNRVNTPEAKPCLPCCNVMIL